MLYLYVAVGGALGSLLRYIVITGVNGLTGRDFPFGTLAVNIVGGFLFGAMLAFLVTLLPRGRELYMLVCVGVLGGFTTFSSFSFDLYMLLERGQALQAIAYAMLSVAASLLAFFCGMWLLKTLLA